MSLPVITRPVGRTSSKRRPPPPTASATGRSRSSQRSWPPWWMMAAVIAAAFAVYASSLNAPFVYDDRYAILDNVSIRQISTETILAAPPNTPVAGRPAVNLSFAFNYWLGGTDPFGYRALNLAIDVGTALLLFGLYAERCRSRHPNLTNDRNVNDPNDPTTRTIEAARFLDRVRRHSPLVPPPAELRARGVHHAAHRVDDGPAVPAHALCRIPRHGGDTARAVDCTVDRGLRRRDGYERVDGDGAARRTHLRRGVRVWIDRERVP